MTATEIVERKREFLQTIGPVFGRLEPSYPAVIVERSFNILMRANALPPMPAVLEGAQVRFEYASPIEKLRKQVDALAVTQWFADLAPMAQADISVLDNVDGDAAARFFAEARGVPPTLLRATEQRDQLRLSRLGDVALEGVASDPPLQPLPEPEGAH
jgi:hypothetical protein